MKLRAAGRAGTYAGTLAQSAGKRVGGKTTASTRRGRPVSRGPCPPGLRVCPLGTGAKTVGQTAPAGQPPGEQGGRGRGSGPAQKARDLTASTCALEGPTGGIRGARQERRGQAEAGPVPRGLERAWAEGPAAGTSPRLLVKGETQIPVDFCFFSQPFLEVTHFFGPEKSQVLLSGSPASQGPRSSGWSTGAENQAAPGQASRPGSLHFLPFGRRRNSNRG